jgi:hypothetical protein
MSTDVDICNLALAHIGDSALITSITGADNSTQATQCARFYPVARDQVLERHQWKFSLKYSTLASAGVTVPDAWSYAYTLPDNCIGAVDILRSGTTVAEDYRGLPLPFTQRVPFSVEMVGTTQVLYCNQAEVTLHYMEKVTDATKYPASVVSAISYLLASYLAGPIIKGKAAMTLSQALRQQFEIAFYNAAAQDAAYTRTESNRSYQATSIQARN